MSHLRLGSDLIPPAWVRSLSKLMTNIGELKAASEIVRAIEQFQGSQFSLALLGKAKRGKSTLANALLGRTDDVIAPIDRLPASNAITRFHWATQESAKVIFRDGREESISYGAIKEYVTEELNQDNRKQVDVVHAWGPFCGLDPSTELIDTPGAGSIHEHHDALLQAFIPAADAVLFLVTARMPLDQDELNLLKQIHAADIRKIFFVMNRIDEVDEQGLKDAIQHNHSLLSRCGIPAGNFHQISAKRAFLGDLSQSGVPELLNEINSFLAANKRKIFLERLTSRVRQAIDPVRQRLTFQQLLARKSEEEVDGELKALEFRKESLEQERALVKQKFSLSWRRAIDEFLMELPGVQNRLTLELQKELKSPASSDQSHQISTLINALFDRHLKPSSEALELKLKQATDQLRSTYPQFQITSEGIPIFVSPHDSLSLMTASIGGVAAAGTGLGLVAAGAGVATSIGAANAVALAATTTVAVPTALSGILGSVPYVGSILTSLATGTATLSTPAALIATPVWVALSGPVGWTIAGIGVLAIPLAWNSSRLKAKGKLEAAALHQVGETFSQLRTTRIPLMQQMSTSIVEEFQLRLDEELFDVNRILRTQREHRPNEEELAANEAALIEIDEILPSAA
jgi:GTPase Era involved in 16S rRNA processing